MYEIQIYSYGAWRTVQRFATLEEARSCLICYQMAEGTRNVCILYPPAPDQAVEVVEAGR